MKKIITAFIAAFVLISVQNSNAQLGVGAGLAFGTEIETLGIQVGATYSLVDNLRLAADVIYFFPKTEGSGDFETDLKWLEFNGNLHYVFYEEITMNAYGLAGLNYSRLSIDEPSSDIPGDGPLGSITYSESEFGLNLGIGYMYNLNLAWFFAEAKYVVSDFDQLSIVAGLRIPLQQE